MTDPVQPTEEAVEVAAEDVERLRVIWNEQMRRNYRIELVDLVWMLGEFLPTHDQRVRREVAAEIRSDEMVEAAAQAIAVERGDNEANEFNIKDARAAIDAVAARIQWTT